jgi:Asp-tRNA(Asn)/Glu-tRNA(Gln) amidotransferase A subunit family amidase
MPYDLLPMKAPRTAGSLLRALVALVENPTTGGLLANKLLTDAGIARLRTLPTSTPPPARHPVFEHGQTPAKPGRAWADLDAVVRALPAPRAGSFTPETAVDFGRAYREGRMTPVEVAEKALDMSRAADSRTPAMRIFIAQERDDVMAQARASAERFRAGKALGPLDGVPVAVKDELDQLGYPTTVGTRFLGRELATADAEVVARLRAAGALLIGKANMHEIGLGVTGLNPIHGAARNPYDPSRCTGGSSSGPAAAVASGLCPIAVGADGGGSIRIPAALCGQLGLKATFGRISEHGAAELCWSVAHVGPIAATLRDLALGYAVMAGPDHKDPNSLLQPEPSMEGLSSVALQGLRIGIYRPWFEDAEPAIVETCYRALEHLRSAGATVCDISIDNLEVVRVAHLITIVAEMTAAHIGHYRDHKNDYGLDTRLNLALGRRLQGFDYVHAQRHRARLWGELSRVLGTVDAIATPATGCTAPALPNDALESGESNLEVTGDIMRFAPMGNLFGVPAISLPAGYDGAGLPIGIQFMARPWDEALLFRLAAALDPHIERREPRVHLRYGVATG